MATAILINGKSYTFAQINVKALGLNLASVSKVTYKETQEKENNYGAGLRPVSRGAATIKATASITMSMNDVEAIRDAATKGSLLSVPAFDIEVSFLNEQKVVTHILKNCEFTSDGVEASLDDKDLKMDFELVLSHVEYRQ
jgi:hypothetical protein